MGVFDTVGIVKENAKGYLKGLNEARKAAKDVANRYRQMYGVKATYERIKSEVKPVPSVGTPTSVSAQIKPKKAEVTKRVDIEL